MVFCSKCGAKLPEDARFCPSCGSPVGGTSEKPSETVKTFKVTGKPQVFVINTASGLVEVERGSEGEVAVNLQLKAPDDMKCDVSQDGNIIHVSCRPKMNPFLGWPLYIFSGGPRANITISVPNEADLDIENHFERTTVTGVKGTIKVESYTAPLKIRDCEGMIAARTKTGEVEMENVVGTVSVRNATGSIRFSGSLSKGENWFSTKTGNIELELRGEQDLAVEASSRLGKITCTPELIDAHYEHGQHVGRIGSGAGKLILETKTGNIALRH